MMEFDVAALALHDHDSKAIGHDAKVRDPPVARVAPHLIE
jgi:hypothetical protein